MNDMTVNPAGIGHNNPPLAETLGDKYADLVKESAELLARADTVPSKVEDDKTAEDLADLGKKLTANGKALEQAEAAEKAPHQLVITQIGGFFKRWTDKVEPAKKKVKGLNADYKARKDAEAAKAAAELAAQKRAEEERQRREARDAADTAAAARAAQEEFDRLEREAVEAKASAVSEQEKAQAAVAEAEAKLAKIKAENAQIAATYAKRVVDGDPVSDEERAEKRADAEARLKAAKADLEAARELRDEARERAKQAREAMRKAEEEAAAKKADAERAEREQKAAERLAERSGNQAQKIENKLQAGEIDSGGIRSIHGALQTSQKVWKCEVLDRNALDKEALWNLIHGDAIDVALRKWMLLQPEDKRAMEGARFWEEDQAVIR